MDRRQEREDKQTLRTQDTDVHTHMYRTVYRSICCNVYIYTHTGMHNYTYILVREDRTHSSM